jgi:hypothetical protein
MIKILIYGPFFASKKLLKNFIYHYINMLESIVFHITIFYLSERLNICIFTS